MQGMMADKGERSGGDFNGRLAPNLYLNVNIMIMPEHAPASSGHTADSRREDWNLEGSYFQIPTHAQAKKNTTLAPRGP